MEGAEYICMCWYVHKISCKDTEETRNICYLCRGKGDSWWGGVLGRLLVFKKKKNPFISSIDAGIGYRGMVYGEQK